MCVGYVQLDVLESMQDLGAVTVLQLVDYTGREPKCIRSAMDGLRSKGYVSRTVDCERGNRYRYQLTAGGVTAVEIMHTRGYVGGVPYEVQEGAK